jgi:hypothetical protein
VYALYAQWPADPRDLPHRDRSRNTEGCNTQLAVYAVMSHKVRFHAGMLRFRCNFPMVPPPGCLHGFAVLIMKSMTFSLTLPFFSFIISAVVR